jgi:hypothetical protein
MRPTPALACKCMNVSLREIITVSNVIFFGTVLSRRVVVMTEPLGGDNPPLRMPAMEYGFEVKASWRGPLNAVLVVTAPTDRGSCGLTFQVGREYFVSATQSVEGLFTDSCSDINDPEVAKVLGPPVVGLAPADLHDSGKRLARVTSFVAATVAGVGAAIIAILMFRRRSRNRQA